MQEVEEVAQKELVSGREANQATLAYRRPPKPLLLLDESLLPYPPPLLPLPLDVAVEKVLELDALDPCWSVELPPLLAAPP